MKDAQGLLPAGEKKDAVARTLEEYESPRCNQHNAGTREWHRTAPQPVTPPTGAGA